MKRLIFLVLALATVFGCKKDELVEEPPTATWLWEQPAHFPAPVYTSEKLVYSKASFELGKKLFYDPVLSKDNTISCGSCHHQQAAFSDVGKDLSVGIEGQLSARNSPALINLAWHKTFMWDGGVNHVEVVSFAPITNPHEMGDNMSQIITKLNDDEAYVAQFREVFDKDEIDDQQLLLALTHYLISLVSANAKYDQVELGTSVFSTSEAQGFEVFKANCATCHTAPLFTNGMFANNGLDTVFADSGRYKISLDIEDMGKFQVPTLRNIALTAPYMHDGRFNTLEEVIAHYSENIRVHSTLSSEIPEGGMHLSENEAEALIDFLYTLNDEKFITNPTFHP